jgi:hypothetical protein
VDVPIESVDAGGRGNLDTNLVQAIEGPLGLKLAVTNPAPTTGGSEIKVPAPSAADRERVRGVLLAGLRLQGQQGKQDRLSPGSGGFPASVKEMLVLEETYDPPAGRTGGTLSLSMRVKFSAQYASGADLSQLAALALSASMETGFAAAPESLKFKLMDDPITDETGRTSFSLKVEQRIQRVVDARQVLALTQGRRLETAQARLKNAFPFAPSQKITVSPAWWPWLPLAPFRIQVVIQ